jgi:hypothetical protein
MFLISAIYCSVLLLLLVMSATDLADMAENFRQFELKLILLGNECLYIYIYIYKHTHTHGRVFLTSG